MPKVILHHPVLSAEAGAEFVKPFRDACGRQARRALRRRLRGLGRRRAHRRPHRRLLLGHGRRGNPDGEGSHPVPTATWLKRLAPGAAATIAIGTCATWGGVPSAEGNPTGAMSVMDFLGKDYRSAFGLPVINIPGCAPQGDNFTETVFAVLLFLQGLGPLPDLRRAGPPGVALPRHGAPGLHARRILRGGHLRQALRRSRSASSRSAAGARSSTATSSQRGAINHMGGCMKAGRHLHRVHDARLPRQVQPVLQDAAGRRGLDLRGQDRGRRRPPTAATVQPRGQSRASLGRHRRGAERVGARPGADAHGQGDQVLLRAVAAHGRQEAGTAARASRIASGAAIDPAIAATTSTGAPAGRTAMTNADLWAAWRLWMLVASVIVLVAAGLLITIWLTARSIASHATPGLERGRGRSATTHGRSGSCRPRTRWPSRSATPSATSRPRATKLVEALQGQPPAGGRSGRSAGMTEISADTIQRMWIMTPRHLRGRARRRRDTAGTDPARRPGDSRRACPAIWTVGQQVANNTIHIALLDTTNPRRRRDPRLRQGRSWPAPPR